MHLDELEIDLSRGLKLEAVDVKVHRCVSPNNRDRVVDGWDWRHIDIDDFKRVQHSEGGCVFRKCDTVVGDSRGVIVHVRDVDSDQRGRAHLVLWQVPRKVSGRDGDRSQEVARHAIPVE